MTQNPNINTALTQIGVRRNPDTAGERYRLPIAVKLAASFALPLLVGMGILAYIMIDSHRDFQQQQLDRFATVLTGQLAASAVEPLFADASMELGVLVNRVPLGNGLMGVALYDHEGAVIASSGMLPAASSIRFGQLSPVSMMTPDGDQLYIEPVSFRSVVGGYAVANFDTAILRSGFDQMAYALFIVAITITLSLCLVMLLMSRRMTAPLKTIASVTAGIDAGKVEFIPERRNDELGQLIRSINRMTKDLARKSQVETVLQQFLAKDVADKILGELDTVNLKGENVEATALFADIVGFTRMSETMDPDEVSQLLNEYFGYYAACAKLYFGTVDKFLGDCIMIVFGAAKSDERHQYHAVACARLMQRLNVKLNERRVSQGLEPIELRIGINSGRMLAGLLGSQDRMEYTVIGAAVNQASRLCNEASAGQIIIQEDCHQALSPHCKVQVDSAKTIRVRGKENPVSIYNVTQLEHHRSSADTALINDLLYRNESNRRR